MAANATLRMPTAIKLQRRRRRRRRRTGGRRRKVEEENISHLREVNICSAEMPRHCSAGGCKSRDNRGTRSAGITFHKLPKGAPRRNLWITNSHRADSWDPQTDFVYFCSKHFSPDSFELSGCSGIRRLKEDAFPTVFVSSSTTKYKRAERPQTPEDLPVRKSPCSPGHQEDTQLATDRGQSSEEATDQLSVAADEETLKSTPASSQETSGLEQQEQSPAPESVSPSRYMRRLPPLPGFYLPKEHSYAQLCPLLWRRRYDKAIDCLEKTLRQLHAARRRENRLRSTVLRLRDKRLKHTLLLSQEGCKSREELKRPGSNQKTDARAEDTRLFEDKFVAHCLPDTNSWSKQDEGYCFHCGRGQDRLTGIDVQLHEEKDIQIVRLEKPPNESLETIESGSQFLLRTPGFQHVSLPGFNEQKLSSREAEVAAHLDLQQQLLWIQDSAEGQVILVPVPAEDGLQGLIADKTQTVLVSELALGHSRGVFRVDPGRSRHPSRGEPSCDDEHRHQHSVINSTTVAEMGEDVREKLKEHLEGFHLQLSTEFIN